MSAPWIDADRGERWGNEDPQASSPGAGGGAGLHVVGPGGVPGRRTVTIQGRGAERYTPPRDRRRPQRRLHERSGFRPDRVAMWAVLLGVVLVLAAATSSRAMVIDSHAGARKAPSSAVVPAGRAVGRSRYVR